MFTRTGKDVANEVLEQLGIFEFERGSALGKQTAEFFDGEGSLVYSD